MNVRDLREKFLAFFESKGHKRFPSGSLVPYDVTGRLDESLLFNGAGMIQFKPYFRGAAQPEYRRLMTAQKCVRTGDIETVGDDTHLTFFEMMGNFSFGDYFKAEAIAFSWEFLTSKEWLALDPRRLAFTIFEDDDEAYEEWSKWLKPEGIDPSSRIFRLDEETNYWPAGAFSKGPPGPCGPNSEMFYWVADTPPPGAPYSKEDFLRDDAAVNWVEIWNDVFIRYDWQGYLKNPARPAEGYVKEGMPDLPFKSIDTGMGLERTAIVLGGLKTIYDTDVFEPIFRKLRELTGGPNTGTTYIELVGPRSSLGSEHSKQRAERIIADHIRTAAFCVADGVLPSNGGRGYVLRRLIRRAVLKGQRVLGLEKPFFHQVFEAVLEAMGDFYTELWEHSGTIVETLKNEEAQFRRTLEAGLTILERSIHESFRLAVEDVSTLVAQTLPPGSHQVIPSHKISYRPPRLTFHPGSQYFEEPIEVSVGDPASMAEVREKFAQMLRDYAPEEVDTLRLLEHPVLSGDEAFTLYSTYGFPLEVTVEIANEYGFSVDIAAYEQAMAIDQERSRAGQGRVVYGSVRFEGGSSFTGNLSPGPTVFTGYSCEEGDVTIVQVQPLQEGRARVALSQTPFYAESGGQVGDRGSLVGAGFELEVSNTTKSAGTFWHEVEYAGDPSKLVGEQVHAVVDAARRSRIRRNHTATHLLHAALRRTLGTHVTQAGSYVGPEGLRFDFTHGKAMSMEELAEVEAIVNREVLANTQVETRVDLPIQEAKARGAMALFGEKYGDKVRMVEVGEFSRELCGGTHVRTTGEIGLFKILSESSAASGVRRIEAISGEAAYEWAVEQDHRAKELAALLKTNPKELVPAVERVIEQAKDERRRREKAELSALSKGEAAQAANLTHLDGVALWRRNLGDLEPKLASQAVDNAAAGHPEQVTLAAAISDGKVTFYCKVGPDAVGKGAHAGNLVREVAKVAGGGGGGRPDFATAGGKQPEKLDEALAASEEILKGMLHAVAK